MNPIDRCSTPALDPSEQKFANTLHWIDFAGEEAKSIIEGISETQSLTLFFESIQDPYSEVSNHLVQKVFKKIGREDFSEEPTAMELDLFRNILRAPIFEDFLKGTELTNAEVLFFYEYIINHMQYPQYHGDIDLASEVSLLLKTTDKTPKKIEECQAFFIAILLHLDLPECGPQPFSDKLVSLFKELEQLSEVPDLSMLIPKNTLVQISQGNLPLSSCFEKKDTLFVKCMKCFLSLTIQGNQNLLEEQVFGELIQTIEEDTEVLLNSLEEVKEGKTFLIDTIDLLYVYNQEIVDMPIYAEAEQIFTKIRKQSCLLSHKQVVMMLCTELKLNQPFQSFAWMLYKTWWFRPFERDIVTSTYNQMIKWNIIDVVSNPSDQQLTDERIIEVVAKRCAHKCPTIQTPRSHIKLLLESIKEDFSLETPKKLLHKSNHYKKA